MDEEQEMNRRRENLAEALLRTLAEDVEWYDSGKLASDVQPDLVALARAATAAAAVIYPYPDSPTQEEPS